MPDKLNENSVKSIHSSAGENSYREYVRFVFINVYTYKFLANESKSTRAVKY